MAVGGLQDGFEFRLLGGQGIEVGIRLGIGGIDFVQSRLGILDHADRFLDDFADGFRGVELRLLGQVAHVQAGHRPGFAVELGVDAGHDAQQRGFAGAVEAQHADLGAGEEGQGNVLENLAFRRNHFAQPMHGVDVLSHGNECP